MKYFLHLMLLIFPFIVFSQPRLIGTMGSFGKLYGGGIFRSDLPGIAPDTIHFFNNLVPHAPRAGVCRGDGNWLYGMMQFNGVNNQGCLYRIQQDGSGFTVLHQLANGFSGSIPVYHKDGKVYFSDLFELKSYDPLTETISSIALPGALVQRNLLIDSNDWVYINSFSEIYKIKTDGTQYTSLHSLNFSTDGSNGMAGMIEIPGDSLLGLNYLDGANGVGTIFSLKKDGTGFTVLHHFESSTGMYPESGLLYYDGKLFGTTSQGGNHMNGVVYALHPDGSDYHVVHHFPVTVGGGSPGGNIFISSQARIMGAFLQYGREGFNDYRMYKLDTSGANYELFFTVNQRMHGHGHLDPLYVNDDSIFILTGAYGRHDGGVFSITDTSGTADSLFHFGQSLYGHLPNGLIRGSDLKLYGTTQIGGVYGNGIIYSMNDDGTGFVKLHDFTDAEGYRPLGKLLEASDGKLYGTLSQGGPHNTGTIFRMNRDGTGFQVIYNNPSLFGTSKYPLGGLIEGPGGMLFGMNRNDSIWYGSVYRLNKDGSGYAVIKGFDLNELIFPATGLSIQGNTLYGACMNGGSENRGGIFRVNTDGSGYQELYVFTGSNNGYQPMEAPILASNGKLYGTTVSGGNSFEGILYSIETNGSNYTILRHFSSSTDGSSPFTSPIQASDGKIYGTTAYSGPVATGGTVYRMDLDGSNFTVIRNFDSEIQGNSSTGILDLQPFVILPVQWLSFQALQNPRDVLLKWKVAQEVNNDHFEVQRSFNSKDFELIGRVAASSVTGENNLYDFTDEHPVQGMNFYRLRQVDKDGRFSYSKIVQVRFAANALIKLYPNPVQHELTINLQNGGRLLEMYDLSGRRIEQYLVQGRKQFTMNVSNLPKGNYVLRLDGKPAGSFLKQ